MEDTDLPPELDALPDRRNFAAVLDRVLGGAELVGYHPEKGVIACWYGGTGFNVYDPARWHDEAPDVSADSGEVHHFNVTGSEGSGPDTDEAARTMENYGFNLTGVDLLEAVA